MKTIRERLEPLESRTNDARELRHKLCRQCEGILYPGETAWFDAIGDVFCSAQCGGLFILEIEKLDKELALEALHGFCAACRGFGRQREDDGSPRKCLDCNGTGKKL